MIYWCSKCGTMKVVGYAGTDEPIELIHSPQLLVDALEDLKENQPDK